MQPNIKLYFRGTSRPEVFPIREDGELPNKEQQQSIRRSLQTSKQKDGSNGNESVLEDGKNGQLHYIGGIEGKRKKWLDNDKNNSRNFSQGQRVYGVKGISSTLAGNAGGLGGKTGLYAIRQPLKFLKRNQKNIEGDYAFTVDGANTGGVRQGMKIRRLIPIECERLQGFPDNFTKYGIDENGNEIEISDTQRYKCLGNAVTTNVVTEIIKRLK